MNVGLGLRREVERRSSGKNREDARGRTDKATKRRVGVCVI